MSGRKIYFIVGMVVLLVSFEYGTVLPQSFNPIKLAIIDTVDREQRLYQPTIDILKSVGFKVTYKPLDLVIDQSITQIALPRYKAVFFIVGPECLGGVRHPSYLGQKVLQLVELYSKLPGVLIGFVLPSLRPASAGNIVSAYAPFFDRLGFKTPLGQLELLVRKKDDDLPSDISKLVQSVNNFFYVSNIFLSHPLETRPLWYHTMLCRPHKGIEFDIKQMDKVLCSLGQSLFLLPLKRDCLFAVKKTLPYGLYWHNLIRKNNIFFTTLSIFKFAGIAESFHICPSDFMLRRQMLSLVQQMMLEIFVLSQLPGDISWKGGKDFVAKISKPSLPSSVASVGSGGQKRFLGEPCKIAWMELFVFENNSKDFEDRQNKLIEYILGAGVDSLWITINPHMYFSKIGRLSNKKKVQKFLRGLSCFTTKIKDECLERRQKPPLIFVGYEITNNIYEPHLPKCCAVDIYENVYEDLPVPIDRTFWRDEVIKPLEILVKKWKDPKISHGIRLGGVVLDLEMYCRKKTGTFFSTMGFDGLSFRKFLRHCRLEPSVVPRRDRALVLMKQKMGRQYFRFLEKEAEEIGIDLRGHFSRLIPDCKVMCYMPNINVSWFYKGLCRGLATKKKPIHLLTFNSEFFAHEEWLRQNKISAHHSGVLLLSKLRSLEDFGWVDYLLEHHQGLWLNRFSRLVEPKTRGWTSDEQPAIPENEYSLFTRYLKNRK